MTPSTFDQKSPFKIWLKFFVGKFACCAINFKNEALVSELYNNQKKPVAIRHIVLFDLEEEEDFEFVNKF